jgi:hypothetical protein
MLIILGSMALLAIYANVQHFRRDQVETVVIRQGTPLAAPSR